MNLISNMNLFNQRNTQFTCFITNCKVPLRPSAVLIVLQGYMKYQISKLMFSFTYSRPDRPGECPLWTIYVTKIIVGVPATPRKASSEHYLRNKTLLRRVTDSR